MDALLPSEIARLVLGYLQEQKCDQVAKTFMETCPLLQECRIVAQRGGRYSTKVGGLSLVDILDKYCAANAMVQEKLNKVSDCDQVKHCNDLIEQLRYLLEGSRGQCFVVNISVPSQSSPAGAFGSPIVSGSTRKRHHSNSERGKRVARSLSNLMDKPIQNLCNQSCNTVETTPLESLPGHTASIKQIDTENHNNNGLDKSLEKTEIVVNTSNENIFNVPIATSTGLPENPNLLVPSSVITNSNCKDQSTETGQKLEEPIQNKCTAGTNTEELMNYCSTEVQTGPIDFIEVDTDDNLHQPEKNIHEEAIENLSIVHSELLHNKELQEQLADNINKIVNESATDPNVSLLSAVKSAVEATDNDPVFDKFLHELFMVRETETSPDDDSDARFNQESNDQIYARNDEPMEIENNIDSVEPIDSKLNSEEPTGPEVPLKQRLRSSFKSQGINVDEEEKESNTLLDNQNEEAVRSIVNVITSKRNSLTNNDLNIENDPAVTSPVNTTEAEPLKPQSEPLLNSVVEPEKSHEPSKVIKPTESNKTTKPRKTRKPRTTKPKQPAEPIDTTPVLMPETETMPTLILCTERDVNSVLPINRGSVTSGYLPIAPKPDDAPAPTSPKLDPTPVLYLRTVNVPRHLVNPATLEASKKANPLLLQTALQLQQQPSPQKPVNAVAQQQQAGNDTIVVPIVVTDDKSTAAATVSIPSVPAVESITLYGSGENDNNAEMKMTPISSMPVISLDDSAINFTDGTGLSPFFKGVLSSVAGETAIAGTGLSPFFKSVVGSVTGDPGIAGSELSPLLKGFVAGESVVEDVAEAPKEESIKEQIQPEPEKEAPKADDEQAKVDVEPMETSTEPEEKVAERRVSIDEAIIAKRTPRTLLKSRAKNNRLSLSTPRRRNSHVRALDFNTPVKNSGIALKTPQSCTRSKSVCRAGLFKSPPFSSNASNINLRGITNTQTVKKVRTISPVKQAYIRVPIATRSPAPKLQGNWGKVTGIGMILGETSTSESSPEKSQPDCSPNVDIVEVKEETKVKTVSKSWDSDLRKIVGVAVNEEDEEKSKPKSAKKGTGRKRSAPIKEEDTEQSEKKTRSKTKTKRNEADEKDSPSIKAQVVEDKINDKKITVQGTTEILSPTAKKLDAKCNDENKPKNANTTKISPESHGPISRILALDLETPRKTEVACVVPPTPKILATPGTNLKSQRAKQHSEISIKACVDTPEFPVTPCIVYTPKVVEDDGDKKPSPYYEPDEQTQLTKAKEIANTAKTTVQETKTTVTTVQRNVVELQEHKTVEITQFGIIEKEVVQVEKEQELTSGENSKENVEDENVEDTTNTSANSCSDSDDSSDSDSSSSSSMSDSSSSSSSSDSSPASSPEKAVPDEGEPQNNENSAESEIDSPETLMHNFSKVSQEDLKVNQQSDKNENSPKKVFPVLQDDADDNLKETPAKDENSAIPEAEISETPSVSEEERALRRDSLTNLNSKISAIITTSQSDQSLEKTTTAEELNKLEAKPEMNLCSNVAKPRIVSIQRIAPTDGMTQQVSKLLQSSMQKNSLMMLHQQQQAANNAKLSQQLQEKRLRVMAKFKETNFKGTGQLKKSVDDAKRKAEKPVFSTADNLRSKSRPVQIPEKIQSTKTDKKVIEKVVDICKAKLDDKKIEEDSKELKKGRGKASPRKKTAPNDQPIKTEIDNAKANSKAVEKDVIQNTAKDAAAVVTAEKSKGISKAKVDQVKRDLFSDEEINEQMTTRSQTSRRTIDIQKTGDQNQNSTTINNTTNANSNTSQESLKENSKKSLKKNLIESSRESSKVCLKDKSKDSLKKASKESPKENHKENLKESPKKISKESSKENLKESPKKISKESLKENSKESPKGSLKESLKESPKKSLKESSKESLMESTKESSDEISKESSNDIAKESSDEISKESSKDTSKESSDEISKESSKDISKESSDEISKESSNNISKESSEEILKESSKDISKESLNVILKETSEENLNQNPNETPMEELPGVLEVLQLRPANKSELELHDLNLSNSFTDGFSNNELVSCEVSFIYDESVPIKKRKRIYSNSELKPEITFEDPDEGLRIVLNVMDYDELFTLTPKNSSKKKASSPKKSPTKKRKSKTYDQNGELPLATSSPLKGSNRKEKSCSDHTKRKSSKRKASPIKEEKQVEVKKSKADPKTLFNKIKIEELLRVVHGSD